MDRLIAILTLSVSAIGMIAVAGLCVLTVRRRSPAPVRADVDASQAIEQLRLDLIGRLGESDDQYDNFVRRLDRIEQLVSELTRQRIATSGATALAASAKQAPAAVAAAGAGMPAPLVPADVLPPPAPRPYAPAQPMAAMLRDPLEPLATDPPAVNRRLEALVDGYREKIAQRSRGPIRDWLNEHQGFTVQPGDGDSLVRSDQGFLAAIPIDGRQVLLVPNAGFVVDFATQYASNQLGVKQIMRNVYEPVADRGGEMKLLTPATAQQQGDQWVLDQPGRLGGFNDA